MPFAKSVPKEMLPIIDRPAIQYIVEEAVAAGIDDVLAVVSPHKKAIEDHFDRAHELEAVLAAGGKDDILAEVRALADLVDLHSVRQGEALGLGHAVGMARHHVGDNNFAVLLGDDMMHPESSLLRDMIRATTETGVSTVALMRVPRDDISLYGAAAVEPIGGGNGNPDGDGSDGGGSDGDGSLVKVTGLVEKPPVDEAPSDLAVIGRYVFTPEIFEHIERTEPGAGGEIQLTDAMAALADGTGLNGVVFEGGRYDVGNKRDYLRTILELSVERDDLRDDVLAVVGEFARQQGLL